MYVRHVSRIGALALYLATALGVIGCGAAPMDYLHTSGTSADHIATLGWGLLGISIAVVVICVALLLAAIFRRRAPAQRDGAGRMEVLERGSRLSWIYLGAGISTVVLFGCTVWTLRVLAQIMQPSTAPALTIQITAHEWWWEARYRVGATGQIFSTANELHIPIGQPVRIELTSDDVIHSFWVPQLAGKMDVIPGRTNVTWMEARTPGRYRGQCAEFCGLQHAHMAIFLVAESTARFDTWWTHQLAPASGLTTGRTLFEERCGACHSIRGTDAHGIAGPDLSHLAGRATLAAGTIDNNPVALGGWLDDPQRFKPGTLMPRVPLSGDERNSIVTFLQALE
jgi:cytochrome c oxidase subunit 2